MVSVAVVSITSLVVVHQSLRKLQWVGILWRHMGMDVIAKMDIEKVEYNIRRGTQSVYVNDEEVRCSFRLGRPTNNHHHPKLMSSSSSSVVVRRLAL